MLAREKIRAQRIYSPLSRLSNDVKRPIHWAASGDQWPSNNASGKLSEGMKNEEFPDGVTEELIDRLSKIPGVRVPGPTAAGSECLVFELEYRG